MLSKRGYGKLGVGKGNGIIVKTVREGLRIIPYGIRYIPHGLSTMQLTIMTWEITLGMFQNG